LRLWKFGGKRPRAEKGPGDSDHKGRDGQRVEINRLFEVVRYGDLWEVLCKEDRVSTLCGAFYILYLRNIHRILLIDAGFIRHATEITEVFGGFEEQFGVGLEGVIAVLCTHLHADHLGNPEWFPRATYYAHEEAVRLLRENPGKALYKDFHYDNGEVSITIGDEVEALTRIIEDMEKAGRNWIQTLPQCPYADRGLLIDLVRHYPGLRWGKTAGHAAGHCSFILHLPQPSDSSDRKNPPYYRHFFLGDCLSQDQSPGADGKNLGRRWIRSFGLNQLRRSYSIHPSHRLSGRVDGNRNRRAG